MSTTNHPGTTLSNWWLSAVVALGSLIIGMGRFFIPGHELSLAGSYEAIAHIWVGFLIACGVLPSGVRKEAWIGLGVITILELILFAMR